ncbi:MAG: hypothetical protein ABIO61_09350 [Thermomonas sp.]
MEMIPVDITIAKYAGDKPARPGSRIDRRVIGDAVLGAEGMGVLLSDAPDADQNGKVTLPM